MTKESDAELVERALKSDDSAFADLVARYQGKLYALIISHVRNFADAQDLTQEAFLAAYMKLKTLRVPGSFGQWLRKIAVNQCRIHGILKKRNEQMRKGYEDVLAASTAETEREPTQADLWTALSRLPDDQRLVLTLFHLDKQSYQDIADFLEVPRTTVQTRLRYARQALKKEMIDLMKNELQSNRLRIQLLKAFYNSLTSEQKEAIQNEDRKLLFTELTTDQQVYLKQVFHQMWMWEIADAIEHPPLYVRALEESRFFLRGKPGEEKAVMSIRWENPQSDRQINIIKFGV